MKRLMTAIVVVLLLLVCGSVTLARTYDHDDRLFLEVDSTLPYNNTAVDGTLSYGLGFRFWGVFFFSGMISESQEFHTFGTGMKIPMGGFGLVWEWSKGYTQSENGSVIDYCNSRKIGLELDLSQSLGLQVYKKYLSDFSPQSGMDDQSVDLIGAGIVINF